MAKIQATTPEERQSQQEAIESWNSTILKHTENSMENLEMDLFDALLSKDYKKQELIQHQIVVQLKTTAILGRLAELDTLESFSASFSAWEELLKKVLDTNE